MTNGKPVLCADLYDLKCLKSTGIYSGISRSNVFEWHGQFRDGWTESTQHGRKPFMNVRYVLSADEIASSVYTFSGHRVCIAHNGAYL